MIFLIRAVLIHTAKVEDILRCNATTPDISMCAAFCCKSAFSLSCFLCHFSCFPYKCSQQAQNPAQTITLVYMHNTPRTVSLRHKAAQACKNPPWTELNLYSAHDYNSTQLVFLNRLSVFQNPFFPSFLCDTKRYMLIDNQQCWFSGAFSANLCPSGCQRVFTATSVPT